MSEQELTWSAVIAWMSSKAIEMAKNSPWFPWLSHYSDTASKWVSRGIALAATIGIHATFDGQSGDLTIHGLNAANILLLVGEYAKQMMFQQGAYRFFVKPESRI